MSNTFDHFGDAIDQYLGGACDWGGDTRTMSDPNYEHPHFYWLRQANCIRVTKQQYDFALKLSATAEKNGYKRGWICHKLHDKFDKESCGSLIANALYFWVAYSKAKRWEDIPDNYAKR